MKFKQVIARPCWQPAAEPSLAGCLSLTNNKQRSNCIENVIPVRSFNNLLTHSVEVSGIYEVVGKYMLKTLKLTPTFSSNLLI